MSSGAARSALAHLDGWTWLVAEYRVWLITLATVTGLAVPLLVAASKHLPRLCYDLGPDANTREHGPEGLGGLGVVHIAVIW